jgi:F-type H+-transporting ATPase subunit delta
MAGGGTVAAVYAQALLELADERGKRSAIVDDCRALAQSLSEQPELFSGVDDPRLGKHKAKDVLTKALDGKVQKETADLVRLLVDRNRIGDLKAIAGELVERAEKSAGVVHVTATTATDLSSDAQQHLQAGLKRALGNGVVLHSQTDPAIIGGLTLRVGDTYVDGSVRRQLSDMKSAILNAPVSATLWSEGN